MKQALERLPSLCPSSRPQPRRAYWTMNPSRVRSVPKRSSCLKRRSSIKVEKSSKGSWKNVGKSSEEVQNEVKKRLKKVWKSLKKFEKVWKSSKKFERSSKKVCKDV